MNRMDVDRPGSGRRQDSAIAKLAFGASSDVVSASPWPFHDEGLCLDLDDPQQRMLGDFELLELIGEGGMGVVYRARQIRLQREVAVKLLSAGPWAPADFIERFRREAQHAAQLQHPGIVAVHEMGEIDGLIYFAMQLIRGESLAQHLRRGTGSLGGHEAATLTRTICESVAYAHSMGVLHLDLKPANILLDEKRQPRIADFGLARRTGAYTTLDSLRIAGTPGYMAPEQADIDAGTLTEATDVWGIGAILYELLCGRPPFEAHDTASTLKLLRDGIVRKPSRYRRLPADLEAICMKCLRKSPRERYTSARALAEDLGRFLQDKPVQARVPGILGRFRRWTKRQPLLAAMTCLMFLSLASGLGTSLWLWRRSEHNAAATRELNAVLKAMLVPDDAYSSLDNPSAQMSTLDLLARLERNLDDGTFYEPHARAEIELSVGHAYFAAGAWPEARRRLQKALARARDSLGTDAPLTLVIEEQFGLALIYDAHYSEAERIYDHLIAARSRLVGRNHPSTIAALHGQALLLYESDQFEAAKDAFTSLRETARKHAPERLADIEVTLSDLHAEFGHWAEAESLLQSALARSLSQRGPRHPHHISQRIRLGDFRMMQARWDEAEAIFLDIHETLPGGTGTQHPTTLTAAHYLATTQLEQGRAAIALPGLMDVLRSRKEVHGADHPYTLYTMNRAGQALVALRRPREAQILLERALDSATRTGKRKQAFVLLILDNLARARMAQNDLVGAESALSEAMSNAKQLPRYNMRLGMLQASMGELRFRQHRIEDAEKHFRDAESIMTANFGAESPRVLAVRLGRDDLDTARQPTPPPAINNQRDRKRNAMERPSP